MRIYFEEYEYPRRAVEDCISAKLITASNGKENVKFSFVGYLYSKEIGDVVFVLPKVFIKEVTKDVVKEKKAFGAYDPIEVINLSDENNPILRENPRVGKFIFEVSTWLYLSIKRYYETFSNSNNVEERELQNVLYSSGTDSKTSIEIILELIRFAKQYRHLFAYQTIINNSGARKIHWTKTISSTDALIRDDKPYYLNFKTKQKTQNWNEELIVLFYSVMSYLNKKYHFSIEIDFNYQLLSERKVQQLIDTTKGLKLLRKIRKNYFQAEFVQLWKLLYTFFDWEANIKSNRKQDEFLLVRVYNKVFEHMIDVLIGSEEEVKELKYHKDGKQIDHIYKDKSLFPNHSIYYIADSKYYKETTNLNEYSRYKQFTYAKNVIQYNINLCYTKQKNKDYMPYRDELTQGYNPTPNFFISAYVKKMEDLRIIGSEVGLEQHKYNEKVDKMYHFENRLFDRDTLFTQSYDINFLFVLSYYVHHVEDERLRQDIRGKFRANFIELIEDLYQLYDLKPREGIDAEAFIKSNFYELIGKIFRVEKEHYILALENKAKYAQKNNKLLEQIKEAFDIVERNPKKSAEEELLRVLMMLKFANKK